MSRAVVAFLVLAGSFAFDETATSELWVVESGLWFSSLPEMESEPYLDAVRRAIRSTVGLVSDTLTLGIIDRKLRSEVELTVEGEDARINLEDHRGCRAFLGVMAEVFGPHASNFKITRSKTPHRCNHCRRRGINGQARCIFAMDVPSLSAAETVNREILSSDAQRRLVTEEVNNRLPSGPTISSVRYYTFENLYTAILMRLQVSVSTSDQDLARAVQNLGRNDAHGAIEREKLTGHLDVELRELRQNYDTWNMVDPRGDEVSTRGQTLSWVTSFGVDQTSSFANVTTNACPSTRPAMLAVAAALAAAAAAAA